MITDEKSPVFVNNSVIDVPVVDEISYDYDEMKGVIDDWANPYDQTKPITVHIPVKPQTPMEALGGKCRICKDTTVLSIRRIKDPYRIENPMDMKKLVENMIERRKDPSHEFCIICQNCIMYMKKIRNARRSSGLSEFTLEDLERIFTK